MRLTLYIKHRGGFFPVYWIKRNHNNITGWFDGGLFGSMLYPTLNDIDIHFTYPADGRLHYTIGSVSAGIKERFFVNSQKNFANTQGYVTVDERQINLFNHMLPAFTPPSLAAFATTDTQYQFPMAGISYLKGELHYTEARRRTHVTPSSNNLVIDLEAYTNVTINPCAILLGNGSSRDSFRSSTHVSVIDDSSPPVIILYANITPK